MKSRWLLRSILVALIVVNAACSGEGQSENESASTGAPDGAADLPQSEADLRKGPAEGVPVISARTYTGGSATTKVTGSFGINGDIPINTAASYSDGSMTWLQYGVSGAGTPNFLLTVSADEVGISVAHGKPTATAGATACKGDMEVAANTVSGKYTCPGVTSYDPRNAKMGEVKIEVAFTATSP